MEIKAGYKKTEVGVIPDDWDLFIFGDIIDYTKDIAIRLKEISHVENTPQKSFFRVKTVANFEEVLTNLRYVKFPALVLLYDDSGQISGRNIDFTLNEKNFTWFIIKKANANDFDAQDYINRDIDILWKKIFSKVKRDVRYNKCTISVDLDYFPVGPIADNIFGRGYNMSFADDNNYAYNELDWNEITP